MAIIDITGGYLYWQRGREKVRIEAWGKDALRVRATKNAEIDLKEDWALLPKGEIEGVVRLQTVGGSLPVVEAGVVVAHDLQVQRHGVGDGLVVLHQKDAVLHTKTPLVSLSIGYHAWEKEDAE